MRAIRSYKRANGLREDDEIGTGSFSRRWDSRKANDKLKNGRTVEPQIVEISLLRRYDDALRMELDRVHLRNRFAIAIERFPKIIKENAGKLHRNRMNR